jgi:hypothetical protein
MRILSLALALLLCGPAGAQFAVTTTIVPPPAGGVDWTENLIEDYRFDTPTCSGTGCNNEVVTAETNGNHGVFPAAMHGTSTVTASEFHPQDGGSNSQYRAILNDAAVYQAFNDGGATACVVVRGPDGTLPQRGLRGPAVTTVLPESSTTQGLEMMCRSLLRTMMTPP